MADQMNFSQQLRPESETSSPGTWSGLEVGQPEEVDLDQRPVKIDIDGIRLVYRRSRGGDLEVLQQLSLRIHEREFMTIVGTSGCGKSTLLNIVAGLLPPTQGRVLVKDQPVTDPGPDRVMVFQDDAVFPWYTVRQNVEYGLRVAGLSHAECHKQATRYLQLTGLAEFEHAYPRELSGGMRKRVDLARALATMPEVILMDEPFAALDVMTKEGLQVEFAHIWQQLQMTVLFVTHDIEEALFMADRVVVMAPNPGRVKRVVDVPFPRPRDIEIKTDPAFQALRRELIHELRASP
jgi:NitT/TauT family transport system ATP-binding protein